MFSLVPYTFTNKSSCPLQFRDNIVIFALFFRPYYRDLMRKVTTICTAFEEQNRTLHKCGKIDWKSKRSTSKVINILNIEGHFFFLEKPNIILIICLDHV